MDVVKRKHSCFFS